MSSRKGDTVPPFEFEELDIDKEVDLLRKDNYKSNVTVSRSNRASSRQEY